MRPNETETIKKVTPNETKTTTVVVPSFVSSLKDIKISNTDDNLNYYSPAIKDGKAGSYVLKVKGYDTLKCKCVSIRNLGLKGFNLHILTSKLTEKDVGEYLIETEIYMSGIGKSHLSTKQNLKIKISYQKQKKEISGNANITTIGSTKPIKK